MHNTALDLRRLMAQKVLKEDEYRHALQAMGLKEKQKFFSYYENQDIHDVESFIAWAKKMEIFK